ncbi:MAG: flagellar type III secretion system pore protein FliP [Gammaproteobacteria bacterium]|nr:flagellar type III secretion system pore protein FliP [Gammaproteobacteria bacterium]MCP5202282.1 flagellar type III secretion system pore protein FliP [Gammaproteobacteria bacterium]
MSARGLVFAGLLFVATPAFALGGFDAFSVTTNGDGTQTYTLTLQVLLLMTALTLLPAILLAMTSFTRIIIVLAILRQALGTAQTPSNQILVGLALFMTLFIMSPVLDTVYRDAVAPYLDDQIEAPEAFSRAAGPLRGFMLEQTRESDLVLFTELSGHATPDAPADVPFAVLAPSFITSELKTAFQIGFLIFLPFLIIDLVVASVLMSMGMMMLSPLIISLPFKIMLFVLVDGWALIVGTLAASFYS